MARYGGNYRYVLLDVCGAGVSSHTVDTKTRTHTPYSSPFYCSVSCVVVQQVCDAVRLRRGRQPGAYTSTSYTTYYDHIIII